MGGITDQKHGILSQVRWLLAYNPSKLGTVALGQPGQISETQIKLRGGPAIT